MQKGFACVLIQESAGAGNRGIQKDIKEKFSGFASIQDACRFIFPGKLRVQTAIYLFEAGKPHNQDNLVTFVDFSEDRYTPNEQKKVRARCELERYR